MSLKLRECSVPTTLAFKAFDAHCNKQTIKKNFAFHVAFVSIVVLLFVMEKGDRVLQTRAYEDAQIKMSIGTPFRVPQAINIFNESTGRLNTRTNIGELAFLSTVSDVRSLKVYYSTVAGGVWCASGVAMCFWDMENWFKQSTTTVACRNLSNIGPVLDTFTSESSCAAGWDSRTGCAADLERTAWEPTSMGPGVEYVSDTQCGSVSSTAFDTMRCHFSDRRWWGIEDIPSTYGPDKLRKLGETMDISGLSASSGSFGQTLRVQLSQQAEVNLAATLLTENRLLVSATLSGRTDISAHTISFDFNVLDTLQQPAVYIGFIFFLLCMMALLIIRFLMQLIFQPRLMFSTPWTLLELFSVSLYVIMFAFLGARLYTKYNVEAFLGSDTPEPPCAIVRMARRYFFQRQLTALIGALQLLRSARPVLIVSHRRLRVGLVTLFCRAGMPSYSHTCVSSPRQYRRRSTFWECRCYS